MPREEKNLMAFVEATKDRWMESCFVADGPFFYAALAMLVFSPTRWKAHRVAFLQRLLLLAHVRAVSYFWLKFVFSKKATKIDEIFTVDLTLTT